MTIPTGLHVDGEKDALTFEDYRNEQEKDNASSFDPRASEGVRCV
jgi:hypothetical protein